MRVAITGGAGFVGSHLVDALVERGDDVLVYDTLVPQVHADGPPTWLNKGARYVVADPRCERFLADASGADALVHLAAATGTGQSMYEAASYTRDNAELTAALSDLLVEGRLQVGRVVFTSSRAVYGEGAVGCAACGVTHPGARHHDDLVAQRWQPPCAKCGGPTTWAATSEEAPTHPVSVYGATKLFGEQVLDLAARQSGVPVTVLRPFNLYGARQTPGNPYVGVVAVFAAAVLAGRPLRLYEDGEVTRDFCHVSDAVRAVLAALHSRDAVSAAVNIGSGTAVTLRGLAEATIAAAGHDPKSWPMSVTGQTRAGDLRSCVADVERAERLLGWRPEVPLQVGLPDVLDFVAGRPAGDVDAALAEMARRGLLVGGRS